MVVFSMYVGALTKGILYVLHYISFLYMFLMSHNEKYTKFHKSQQTAALSSAVKYISVLVHPQGNGDLAGVDANIDSGTVGLLSLDPQNGYMPSPLKLLISVHILLHFLHSPPF